MNVFCSLGQKYSCIQEKSLVQESLFEWESKKASGLNGKMGLIEFIVIKGKYNCLLIRLQKNESSSLWIINGWMWGQFTIICEGLDGPFRTNAT